MLCIFYQSKKLHLLENLGVLTFGGDFLDTPPNIGSIKEKVGLH